MPATKIKMQDENWRYNSPGSFPEDGIESVMDLVMKMARQADAKTILEFFKDQFAGHTTMSSSDVGWAETDLRNRMKDASENAPVFIEAFLLGCVHVKTFGVHPPNVNIINRTLKEAQSPFLIENNVIVKVADSSAPDMPAEKQASQPPAGTAPVLVGSQFTGAPSTPHSVQVAAFLCHASEDKPAVKELYTFLKSNGHKPWLDAVDLIAGQNWEAAIRKAVKSSDVVIVCLSKVAVSKTGFGQKEIQFALDFADEQPEGTIYIIPTLLEECVVPDRLGTLHWVRLYETDGHDKLLQALAEKAKDLG